MEQPISHRRTTYSPQRPAVTRVPLVPAAKPGKRPRIGVNFHARATYLGEDLRIEAWPDAMGIYVRAECELGRPRLLFQFSVVDSASPGRVVMDAVVEKINDRLAACGYRGVKVYLPLH